MSDGLTNFQSAGWYSKYLFKDVQKYLFRPDVTDEHLAQEIKEYKEEIQKLSGLTPVKNPLWYDDCVQLVANQMRDHIDAEVLAMLAFESKPETKEETQKFVGINNQWTP